MTIENKPDFTEFKKHMIAAAKELGIDMEITGITYGNENFSMRAECYNGDAGRQEEFARVAAMKGTFPASWFGKLFRTKDGRTLKITGANSRARKNVLTFVDVNTNKETVGSPAFVRAGTPVSESMKPTSLTQDGGVLV